MVQTVITASVVALAITYAIVRAVRILRESKDPCAGCSGCALRAEMRKKAASEKKCPEKFGSNK